MAAIRTAILIFFVLLCSTYSWAQVDSIVYQNWKRDPNIDVSSTTSNQKQIITKEQITQSGYVLLSDVFQLIDGFTTSTWNGDRWNIQNNGSGNYQTQNWLLMIDGQRIELLKLDAQHINAVGLNPHDIERIEVVNAVGNYLGEFNETGIIHIVTKQNKTGLTYRGYLSSGNETGDPQLILFRNVDDNVDKYGGTVGNYLGYKKGNWNIQLNQFANDYFFREYEVHVQSILANSAAIASERKTRSGRASIEYANNKMTHHASIIISNTNDIITPAGVLDPISADHTYQDGAYTFRYNLNKGFITYRGSFVNRTFVSPVHTWISNTQQSQTHLANYTFKKQHTKGAKIYQIGMAYNTESVKFDLDPQKHNYSTQNIRPFLSYTHPLTKKSTVFTDMSLGTDLKTWLPKLTVGYYKQPSVITNWSFVLGYITRSLTEDRSYLSLVTLSDQLENNHVYNAYSQASFDYYYNININKYFKVAFNSGYKIMNQQPALVAGYAAGNDSMILGRMVMGETSQQYWANRINIHYDMLKNIQFDVNYLLNSVIKTSGTTPDNIPKHRLSLTLNYTLPARLSVWTRYYYQSQTEWIKSDYNQFTYPVDPALAQFTRPVDASTPYATLSSTNSFDIGLTKKLLKDYAQLNLSIRNVFNGSEQYQVFGAQYDLRIFISALFTIDGIFAKGS